MKITISYLRVFLALTVFDVHSGIFVNYLLPFLAKYNISFAADGVLAVSGFFIISGYLVHYILSSKYPTKTLSDFFHFSISRYLRIWPLFFVILILLTPYTISHWHYSISKTIAYSTLIIAGLYFFLGFPLSSSARTIPFSTPHIYATPWTLCYDAVFYPLGFLFFKSKKFLYFAFFVFLLLFFVWWIYSPPQNGYLPSFWKLNFYKSPIPNSLAFISGFLAFKINPPSRDFNKYLAIVSFIVILYTMYTPFFLSVYQQQLISIICFSILVSELGKNKQSRFEKPLADFTFAFYLIHYELLFLIKNHFEVFCISFVLALVFGLLIENKIIEKLRYHYIKHILTPSTNKLSNTKFPKTIFYISGFMIIVSAIVNTNRLYKLLFVYPNIKLPYSIYFNHKNSRMFEKYGFCYMENWGTWTCYKKAKLCFALKTPPNNLNISILFNALVSPNHYQRVFLYFNKKLIYQNTYKSPSNNTINLNLHPSKANCLTFVLPDATSPSSLGINKDSRMLGIGFIKMDLKAF
ncbi:MAG: acyltransferase family protein [Candidatus Parvarchaeota archaeon]